MIYVLWYLYHKNQYGFFAMLLGKPKRPIRAALFMLSGIILHTALILMREIHYE